MQLFLPNKYSELKECFYGDLVFEMWPTTVFSVETFLNTISHKEYSLEADLAVHHRKYSYILEYFWPNRFKGSNNKICKYILFSYNKKLCTQCNIIKYLVDYSKDNTNPDKLDNRCRDCVKNNSIDYRINNKEKSNEQSRNNYYNHKDTYIARNIMYKTHRKIATPPWADLCKIKEIYDNCPKDYHVDHVIPLKGKLVSGLHVENNLQYLTIQDNLKKSNKYEIQ